MSITLEIKRHGGPSAGESPGLVDEIICGLRQSFEADRTAAATELNAEQRAAACAGSAILNVACQNSHAADQARFAARWEPPKGHVFYLALEIGDKIITLGTMEHMIGCMTDWKTTEFRYPVTQDLGGLWVAGNQITRGDRMVKKGDEPLAYLRLGAGAREIFVGFGGTALDGLRDRLMIAPPAQDEGIQPPPPLTWLESQPQPAPIMSGLRR